MSSKANDSMPKVGATVSNRDQSPAAATPVEPLNSTVVQSALESAGEAIYEWLPQSDRMSWTGNFSEVLRIDDASLISSGIGYAAFLDPSNRACPYDVIVESRETDNGDGVPFQMEYRLKPDGRRSERSIWVEDRGTWYGGADGRPDRVVGIVRRIDERHERIERLEYLSRFDPLTGHVNRARLEELLTIAKAKQERSNTPGAFLLAAIDNLALINEAYGFDVADEVIASVGRRLAGFLRDGDSIGRYAGNKFGLVLSSCSEQEMYAAAERLIGNVRDTVIETTSGAVAATISVGGVDIPGSARTVTEAMTRAEEALDQAKRQCSQTFVVYKHSQKKESVRRRNVLYADEIISGLNNRRLEIAYQPIVDAGSQEATIYECLLRLRKPDDSIVSAGYLMPVAEKIGLVRMIDHRVLELATSVLEENKDIALSLNVSGLTASDPTWIANLKSFIGSRPDIAERLIVEITETVAIQDIEESARFVSSLRDMGCRIAIDDFGAGYTSFRNLKALDVDMVKIDGSFIDTLAQNSDDQFFVRTLIDLAKNCNLRTVAEWVEDEQSASLLREWGVDYLQGFLFGAAKMDVPDRAASPQLPQKRIPSSAA